MGKHLTQEQRQERESKGLQACCTCKQIKPFAAFSKDRSKSLGLRQVCRACEATLHKLTYPIHRETIRAKALARNRARGVLPMNERYAAAMCRKLDWPFIDHLRRYYGMTKADYYFLFFQQDGRCAICGRQGVLFVDHDHSIPEDKRTSVRGLLCELCNAGIGFLRDDPKVLLSAVAYLAQAPPL